MGLDELHAANLDNAQEDVSQLRFDNRILRLLTECHRVSPSVTRCHHQETKSPAPYSRPWNAHRTRDTDRTNADAMLSRLNGSPSRLQDFHAKTNKTDRRAFRRLVNEKLIVRVKRGFYQKATP